MSAKRMSKKQAGLDISSSFYTDIHLEGMLSAVIVRSPVSCGSVKSISHSSLPPEYFLFTAEDIPAANRVRTLKTEVPVLASDTISYRGEPIALLVGPDKRRLFSLLDELDLRFARSPHGEEPAPSLLAERSIRDEGRKETIEELFARAVHIIENTYTEEMVSISCSEPSGCLAFFTGEQLTVCTPTNWVSHLRSNISAVLGMDSEKISIRKTLPTLNGINSTWYNAALAALASLASRRTGKPVMLEFTRSEQKSFIERPLSVELRCRMAADSEARLLALEIDIQADAGSCNPFAEEILNRMVIAAAAIYTSEGLSITARMVSSANPPAGIHLHSADYRSFFAIENQLRHLSLLTGIHPLDVRLLNLKTDRDTHSRFQFQFTHIRRVIESVAEFSDFERKYAAYHLLPPCSMEEGKGLKTLPFCGIGLACAYEGSGFWGTSIYGSTPSLEVRLETDGSLSIISYPPSPAVCNIWKQIASDSLDIPIENIKIGFDSDQGDEITYPEKIFNNISIMTQLLRRSCVAIQKQRFRSPLPITVKRAISNTQRRKWDNEAFSGQPFHSTSSAALVVELELDPKTYREHIKGVWITIDGGRILNPRSAESTIRRSMQQVLTELVEDSLPNMPALHISFIQSDEDPKQIGELVFNALPAAFSQALSQASGCNVCSLPITTDSIYQLLRQKKTYMEVEANAAHADDK